MKTVELIGAAFLLDKKPVWLYPINLQRPPAILQRSLDLTFDISTLPGSFQLFDFFSHSFKLFSMSIFASVDSCLTARSL
jgi:hypothetical protein